MRKEELQKHLRSCGWSEKNIDRVLKSGRIDFSLSLSEWRETFVGTFLGDHPDLLHILNHACKGLGMDIPTWEDITPQRLKTLKNYLSTVVSLNSARTYLANVKATFSLNAEKIKADARSLSVATKAKKEPSQHIALTEAELELIHRYQPRTQTEADVKRDFMIEAYCGARNSDAKELTEANIDETGEWLVYVSQKTLTKTTVPLHRNILGYIRQPKSKEHNRKVVIDTIQRICFRVGITKKVELFVGGELQNKPKYRFVGSHTARRSFATQLAVRGVPIAMIAKFMGHASPDMTMRYICMETEHITPNVRKFFQG